MTVRRTEEMREVYLVIHGHFYQPPRENPWLEAIEREGSARPYHNWNARIADECYHTNAWARVFDAQGRILDLVNSYRHLSFNFGPTLLSWLAVAMPETYRRILEADRQSARERSGHGNALAQAYGHAILPLCNDRDRLTQIRWGRRDFVVRFGREPEAMWLPETAVDAATVEDLIDEGFRFLILSPRQARAVRPLGEIAWTDVSSSKIDPRQPYRYLSRKKNGRSIDVFFYDGPVSHAISFEKVLHSSEQLMDKLQGAVDPGRRGAQLVHTAVDGETFGHHLRHAERALAWAFRAEAPARGFTLTNYGEYLERHPPTYEVEIDFGPSGEGSAWSCAHGVGRWYRDCSCSAGAPAGWNQAWRTPLRQMVNLVRDEAARCFEERGAELLQDPWAARDAYVDLLLDSSGHSRERFFAAHGREGRRVTRWSDALRLLEMQRMSLLSQTSCGWFFDDISGLEAVQILKYAARTVQLIAEISGRSVEKEALDLLGEARSNLPARGTGADVYRQLVLPAAVSRQRLVAQYAITDMFRGYPEEHEYFGHHIERLQSRHLLSGPVKLGFGRLQVEQMRTGEVAEMTFGVIHFGGHDFHCAVSPGTGVAEFQRLAERLEAIFERATITELLRALDAHFGETYFGLQHLLAEEREDVLDALFGHLTARFAEMYTRLYQEHQRTVNALVDTGLKVPREFRMAAEYTLSRQLNEEIREQRLSRDPEGYRRAVEIVAEASARGYLLDLAESERLFGEMLDEAIRDWLTRPSREAIEAALASIRLAEELQIALPLDEAQNMLFDSVVQGGRAPGLEAELAELWGKLQLATAALPRPEEAR